MLKKYLSATLVIAATFTSGAAAQAQTNSPSTQNSTIGDNSPGNTLVQTNPQNNNSQTINYPYIPLAPNIQNPVNTENDFGVNFGAALNTYDGRNATIYLGITYQPGRTDDHNARMAKLKSETALLESQKQTAQMQLELVKKQVSEQELRLKRLQNNTPTPTSPK